MYFSFQILLCGRRIRNCNQNNTNPPQAVQNIAEWLRSIPDGTENAEDVENIIPFIADNHLQELDSGDEQETALECPTTPSTTQQNQNNNKHQPSDLVTDATATTQEPITPELTSLWIQAINQRTIHYFRNVSSTTRRALTIEQVIAQSNDGAILHSNLARTTEYTVPFFDYDEYVVAEYGELGNVDDEVEVVSEDHMTEMEVQNEI